MLLKRLSEAIGVSSKEDEVRNIIKEELVNYVDELRTDALGNLIAYKKGKKLSPRLMIAAHMDEIGLMITDVTEDGLLSFKPVGGIDKRILVSKRVLVGEDKIPGVIGAKAIHLQKPDERKKPLDYKQLYIDIGTKDKKESENLVELGTMASFDSKYEQLGKDTVKGKAFDDRVGCAALVELMKKDYEFPIYGVFTVQEEVGARGATVAAYDIEPDLALVLEGTTAADIPDIKEAGYVTKLGDGPALTFRDGAMITYKPLLNRLIKVAEDNQIKYQLRKFTKAGTDGGKIHLTQEGIPTAVISVPCRYIHSPAAIINLKDYQAMVDLADKFCQDIEKGGFSNERVD
ncbi:peptidase M42 [Orenia metallireducens]|uniref:Peptidase M42 n=1 Tax=Orenia metallireducens TaxID=1413210 RepID=A0A1C0A858_9FIRM|nr:M42 family metallopeptidase [Orenia metallireducens]OCL26436.1 peptidase M42 [Orenia metallireducens]